MKSLVINAIILLVGIFAGTAYGVFYATEVPEGVVIKGVQIIKAFFQ